MGFVFKITFKLVNKMEFSFLKDPITIENRNGINFIPYSSCNLGYIDKTRRLLKAKLDEHRLKVKNEEIYCSSIASHCWSCNYYFDFTKAYIVSSPI